MPALFYNGRFFQSDTGGTNHRFAECTLADDDGIITHVGSPSDPQVTEAEASGAITAKHDMQGRIVLPGFIDGHMHLLMTGQALQKCALDHCQNLADIRSAIRAFALQHPEPEVTPRLLCKGWMHSMTGGKALASAIDEGLDEPHRRPIYIDSKDLHFTWCNSAALDEMGIQDMAANPPEGGGIETGIDPSDGRRRATGLLSETTVVTVVWPHLARVAPMEEKLAAIRGAVAAYSAAGYTGLVEMAMDENAWEALQQLLLQQKEKETPLPIRFAVHWLITPSKTKAENLAQVDRAIELNRQFNAETSPDGSCRVVGIKVITDGVIDGCTAALTEPYSSFSTGNACPDPVWSLAELAPVVRRADDAGLQVALHAIGDLAVRNAIDALEQNTTISTFTTTTGNGTDNGENKGKGKGRHRIEHLELTSPEDAARLGRLGITASVQPVHADPSILRAWPALLGRDRCERAFAYREFADSGAVLALGSDAPSAPHDPLRNLYTATTRRSARQPQNLSATDTDTDAETVNPHFALGLAAAVAAAAEGSAYSCFSDRWAGRLEAGRSADFAVVDMEWDAEKLLEARNAQTWFKGKKVFDAES